MTWWEPTRHADRRPLLLARNRTKGTIRRWFAQREFVEVDPGCLVVSPGNETHLHAFETVWKDEAGAGLTRYLATSPEFAMKKLLAAGETRIFAFAPAFRNREQASALHAPEFTMLEWYQAGMDYREAMKQALAMLAAAARAVGRSEWTFNGRTVKATLGAELLTVAEAFRNYAGVDLFATVSERGSTDRDGLAAQASAQGIRIGERDSWSDIFSRILVERVEANLGQGRPTLLTEYPIAEAALARPSPDDPRVAERFELYVCGVEIANGFGELTDPEEQRRRFDAAMAEKQHLYGERYPIDEDFMQALEIMPAASGVALGFDRLIMLSTGAPRLEDVLWTPPL
jgi:lysyl-tRNA synthetase class 2